MFTTTLASEASGIPSGTIKVWSDSGILRPAREGITGPGNGDLYTLAQVVGLAVAARLRASAFGLAPAGVKAVVEAFGAVDEAWLREQFRKGKTHFAALHQGRPWLQRKPEYDAVDVQEAYRAVQEQAAK